MAESRVEAWDRLEQENAELRRALEPFARVASSNLCRASVIYKTAADPERQSFQTPSMHRAFNRAAELLRAHAPGVEILDGGERGAKGCTVTHATQRRPVIFCAEQHHEACPECIKAGRCAIAAGMPGRDGGQQDAAGVDSSGGGQPNG